MQVCFINFSSFKHSREEGIHRSPVLRIIHKDLRLNSQVLQEKARSIKQLTDAHSMHALFSVCSLRDNNVITSNHT